MTRVIFFYLADLIFEVSKVFPRQAMVNQKNLLLQIKGFSVGQKFSLKVLFIFLIKIFVLNNKNASDFKKI